MFNAFGTAPTVIAYAEVYNAIQTGVIDAAENEAAGIEQMKFYEVGPNIALTQHAITVRPLCFSGKTFRRLPKDLQDAIVQAGKDAGAYGRIIESTEDRSKLGKMEADGKLKTIYFKERDKLIAAAGSVKKAYAKELGASAVLDGINAVK
jgi:TRAP-type C4-dicarboxylate transport system substrate-binding protein